MRAIGFDTWGGPEVLHPVVLDTPHADEGQLLIRVQAAGVAPVDVMARTGLLAAMYEGQQPPYVAGMEIAGVIEEVGASLGPSLALEVGTPVVAFVDFAASHGGYSELVPLPAASVIRAPNGLTPAEAATTVLSPLTAHNVLDAFGLEPGASLLITGAAGAVGGHAAQLASRAGIRVIAQVKGADEEIVRGFGAQDVVFRSDDLVEAVSALVPEGVDAVLDTAGLGKEALDTARDGGQYTMLRPFADDPGRGITVHALNVRTRATDHATLKALRDDVEAGHLAVRLGAFVPAAEAPRAHELLEQGSASNGRVVLDMASW